MKIYQREDPTGENGRNISIFPQAGAASKGEMMEGFHSVMRKKVNKIETKNGRNAKSKNIGIVRVAGLSKENRVNKQNKSSKSTTNQKMQHNIETVH